MGGCNPGNPPAPFDPSEIFPELDFPGGIAGAVAVRVKNESDRAAQISVTMLIDDQTVHFARRKLPPDSMELFIGPDHAEVVRVEGQLDGEPPRDFPAQEFVVGTDFEPGTVLLIVIPADEDVTPPPPPPAPTLTLSAVNPSPRVNPGDEVSFAVAVENPPTGATMQLFVDPDDMAENGNEIEFAPGTNPETTTVVWHAVEAAGVYRAYAVLSASDLTLTSNDVEVRVNALPTINILSPEAFQMFTTGRAFTASWSAIDADGDDLEVSVRVIQGGTPIEHTVSAVSPTSVNVVVPLAVGPSTLEISATDGFATETASIPVCLTHRLVGRLSVEELTAQESLRITPGFLNGALGTDVDLTSDFTGDGRADLVIGDALGRDPENLESIPGSAFVLDGSAVTQGGLPAELPADSLIALIGELHGARTGDRVAIIPGASASLLIGAPAFANDDVLTGAAYRIAAGALAPKGPTYVGGTKSSLRIQGAVGDIAGMDVATVGELEPPKSEFFDGKPDFGVGATNYDKQRGRVALLPSSVMSGDWSLDDTGCERPGALIFGANVGDELGFSIAGAPLLGPEPGVSDSYSDVILGAPGANEDAGAVYVLAGPIGLHTGCVSDFPPNYIFLDGKASTIRFDGELAGDRAGTSVQVGHFDSNHLADLAIGAPGAVGNRGRVYVVLDVAKLTQPVISLSAVGVSVPGWVMTGEQPFDGLGTALAAADVDDDWADDLVIGVPRGDADNGVVWLIYGRQSLAGIVDPAGLAFCSPGGFAGYRLSGPADGRQLGSSVSGGADLNGDGFAEVVFGAPDQGGLAQVVFGRGVPSALSPDHQAPATTQPSVQVTPFPQGAP